jgi:hypothetical protein
MCTTHFMLFSNATAKRLTEAYYSSKQVVIVPYEVQLGILADKLNIFLVDGQFKWHRTIMTVDDR